MVTVTTLNEVIDTNRITILVPDGAIYLDQGVVIQEDFSNCGIPSEVRCFQMNGNSLAIEFIDDRPNEIPTEIPEWVLNCVKLWYR